MESNTFNSDSDLLCGSSYLKNGYVTSSRVENGYVVTETSNIAAENGIFLRNVQ